MEITITKSEISYRADLMDLPGAPPIGVGITSNLATANLFHNIFHPSTNNRWLKYIKWNHINIVYLDEE